MFYKHSRFIWYDIVGQVAMMTRPGKRNFFIYVQCFDIEVWIGIILAIIFIGLLMAIIKRSISVIFKTIWKLISLLLSDMIVGDFTLIEKAIYGPFILVSTVVLGNKLNFTHSNFISFCAIKLIG